MVLWTEPIHCPQGDITLSVLVSTLSPSLDQEASWETAGTYYSYVLSIVPSFDYGVSA